MQLQKAATKIRLRPFFRKQEPTVNTYIQETLQCLHYFFWSTCTRASRLVMLFWITSKFCENLSFTLLSRSALECKAELRRVWATSSCFKDPLNCIAEIMLSSVSKERLSQYYILCQDTLLQKSPNYPTP